MKYLLLSFFFLACSPTSPEDPKLAPGHYIAFLSATGEHPSMILYLDLSPNHNLTIDMRANIDGASVLASSLRGTYRQEDGRLYLTDEWVQTLNPATGVLGPWERHEDETHTGEELRGVRDDGFQMIMDGVWYTWARL